MSDTCEVHYLSGPDGVRCSDLAVRTVEIACVHEHVKIRRDCGYHSEWTGVCYECRRLGIDSHDCPVYVTEVASAS